MICAFCQCQLLFYRVMFSVTPFGEQELSSSSLAILGYEQPCMAQFILPQQHRALPSGHGDAPNSVPCDGDVPARQQNKCLTSHLCTEIRAVSRSLSCDIDLFLRLLGYRSLAVICKKRMSLAQILERVETKPCGSSVEVAAPSEQSMAGWHLNVCRTQIILP